MTTKTCKNCGAWEGLHHYETNQCPKNGVEAHYTKKQEYQNTYFKEDKEERDLAALRAENAELREALKSMLYLFDRELPDGSIGRIRCDEARVILEKFAK